jgi:hypothetical protein
MANLRTNLIEGYQGSRPAGGRCVLCKRSFRTSPGDTPERATQDLHEQFDSHECNPNEDASQAAVRIVREATEDR